MLVPLGSPHSSDPVLHWQSKHSTGLDQHSGVQILEFSEFSPPLLWPCHPLGSSSCPGWDTESSSGGCRPSKSAAQHCPAHHAPPHCALSTQSVEKPSSPAAWKLHRTRQAVLEEPEGSVCSFGLLCFLTAFPAACAAEE